MDPNHVTLLIGQSLQLNCTALGTDVAYHWIKDGTMVAHANSNMLVITNISESDEGNYKCVARNRGGMAKSKPATVTVYGK